MRKFIIKKKISLDTIKFANKLIKDLYVYKNFNISRYLFEYYKYNCIYFIY